MRSKPPKLEREREEHLRRVTPMPLMWIVLTTVVLACAAPQSPTPVPGTDSTLPHQSAAPKRLAAAVNNEPRGLVARMAGEMGPGAAELETLVVAGLTTVDDRGTVRAQLAEAAPTLENRLWKLFPDGTMETTWTIKPGARWHDGAPVVADDLIFTAQVDQDRELPILRNPAYQSIASLEAPDPRVLTVKWKRPFIAADTLFASFFPKHRLEKIYVEEKAKFMEPVHWTQEFVGTGPYRVREWVTGTHVLLEANDGYVLGRPKIDDLEVKFISDANTLIANVLAGVTELTLGRSVAYSQAIPLRDRWQEGRVETPLKAWIMLYPQFLNPDPPLVANLQFRRALMHGTDRQQLADTLLAPGLSVAADSYLSPSAPEHKDLQGRVVQYEYDPRKAVQMIEGLGYTKASGGVFRDAANQRLSVEIREFGTEMGRLATLSAGDSWQRLGIGVDLEFVAPQREQEREYVYTFPGFLLLRQPNEPSALPDHYSFNAPVAANNFVGRNRARYANPEFDALIDRYFMTIPREERTQVLGDIVHHISEQLNQMGLFYDTEPLLVTNRLEGVTSSAGLSRQGWNAQDWDLK